MHLVHIVILAAQISFLTGACFRVFMQTRPNKKILIRKSLPPDSLSVAHSRKSHETHIQ